MEKRLIVYKDRQPVMKFYVKPENTFFDIENYFQKQGYDIQLYNGKEPLIPYNFDKITDGKILLKPAKSSKQEYRKNPLTGNKDADLLILSNLEDKDLFNFCLANQKAAVLCRDDNFWRNRFYKKYGALLEEAPQLKPEDQSWKNFYMSVIIQLDSFGKNSWSFMNGLRWDLNTDTYQPFTSVVKGAPQTGDKEADPKMWLLNLGETIVIELPLDRYEDMEPHKLRISAKTFGEPYLNPIRVLNQVYQFYQEPINVEEFRAQIDIDNPYAEQYTEKQVKAGKVIRKDMIGERFYEGFQYNGQIQAIVKGKTELFPEYSIIFGS